MTAAALSALSAWTLLAPAAFAADAEISGRLLTADGAPLVAVRCFASPPGGQGRAARTWETEPRGWWKVDVPAGRCPIVFTGPASFVRPIVLTDASAPAKLATRAQFDLATFSEKEWDTKAARAYFQTFTARSSSVTHVGFKLATDGVDGVGPRSQEFTLSVHRVGDGAPSTWPQIGPAMAVPGVDCGGPKSYAYSAGWHSGEVPLEPGRLYAVQLRAASGAAACQAFWSAENEGASACWRVAADGSAEKIARQIWMTVAGDGDGIVIPVNKRVHREFGEFAGYSPRWTQTWTAQGRGLAGVFLYTATSGVQPAMDHQRIAVRIRASGPAGERIGPEKLAAAQCNYTGDASWGVIGAVFAPGEIALEPGRVYAAEFATLETSASIGDFVNLKGQHSDGKPGFNPYRRHASDPLPSGAAFKDGGDAAEFDLDFQALEYERAGASAPAK